MIQWISPQYEPLRGTVWCAITFLQAKRGCATSWEYPVSVPRTSQQILDDAIGFTQISRLRLDHVLFAHLKFYTLQKKVLVVIVQVRRTGCRFQKCNLNFG